jgi:hypothetical protein
MRVRVPGAVNSTHSISFYDKRIAEIFELQKLRTRAISR